MPKPRRVFGGRKQREEVPGLEMILCLGCELGDGPEHVNRPDYPEHEADWRTRLTQPEGTYTFMEWLLRRPGQITAVEAATVERACLALSTSTIAFAGMETEAGVDALNLLPPKLRNTAKHFDLAAQWHERRGRHEFAELYKRRAKACLAAIPITT
jgi:hypothetical protein